MKTETQSVVVIEKYHIYMTLPCFKIVLKSDKGKKLQRRRNVNIYWLLKFSCHPYREMAQLTGRQAC